MPIVFKSHSEEYSLVTNYKVMYSTLMAQSNIYVVKNSGIPDLFSYSGKKYLIVRNPYQRLESFYRDKFLSHPAKAVDSENWRWQYCQQLFLGEDCLNKQPFALAQHALMTTTFDAFINMLPSRFMRDGHLQPQILAVYFNAGSSVQLVDFDAILHMEDESDMMFLNRRLKINTSVLANESFSCL